MKRLLQKAVLNGLHYSGAANTLKKSYSGIASILMLHRTSPEKPAAFAPNAHLNIHPKFLDKLLARLKRGGYDFISMDELQELLISGKDDGGKKLTITLDDGYRDNLEHAVPVFRKHNTPYTFFIAPGLVDGRATIWWEDLEQMIARADHIKVPMDSKTLGFDCFSTAKKYAAFKAIVKIMTEELDEHTQRKVIKEMSWLNKVDGEAHRAKSIMDWKQIGELSKDPLCTIGAHTIHHFAMARLDEEEALFEMHESGNIIKSELGEFPKHFAYPYGYPKAAAERDFELAKQAGYQTAVTTRHGLIRPHHKDSITALPRVSLNGEFQTWAATNALLCGVPEKIFNKISR